MLAKPFAVDREYVEEAADVTGSEVLKELVRSVSGTPFFPFWISHGADLAFR